MLNASEAETIPWSKMSGGFQGVMLFFTVTKKGYSFVMNALMCGNKLTKKFFADLPEGVFVVCSVGMSPLEPSFAEYVAPTARRAEQWARIKEARVDQRNCDVFKRKEDFDEYQKGWRRRPDGGWERA